MRCGPNAYWLSGLERCDGQADAWLTGNRGGFGVHGTAGGAYTLGKGGVGLQPVLILSSPVPGLMWINGRPVGELDGENPIARPVSPQGPVYLQHFPTAPGYLPLTRRLTFSGGRVLPASLEDQQNLWVVAWPGGAVEVELSPQQMQPQCPPPFSPLDLPGAALQQDGCVRVLEPLEDTVGHARLNTYRQQNGVWEILHSELMWAQGCPHWPATPEQTAIALAEACLLGLVDEARGYLSPICPLPVLEDATACLPLPAPLPGGRPAVGLVSLLSPSMAQVRPMYYRASPAGGTQGTWRLDDILVESGGVY